VRSFALMVVFVAMAGDIAVADNLPILKHDPPPGSLRYGESVLVDDGSCPKGTIKELTGGNNVGPAHAGGVSRVKRCVPRPS
jgi:hypothetical protein